MRRGGGHMVELPSRMRADCYPQGCSYTLLPPSCMISTTICDESLESFSSLALYLVPELHSVILSLFSYNFVMFPRMIAIRSENLKSRVSSFMTNSRRATARVHDFDDYSLCKSLESFSSLVLSYTATTAHRYSIVKAI